MIGQKEVRGDCATFDIFMLQLMLRYLGYISCLLLLLPQASFSFIISMSSWSILALTHVGAYMCPVPLQGQQTHPSRTIQKKPGMGKNKYKRQIQWRGDLLSWYAWELICVCLLPLLHRQGRHQQRRAQLHGLQQLFKQRAQMAKLPFISFRN